MSMITLEVELDHGRVVTKGNEPLPDHAFALLTILPAKPAKAAPRRDFFECDPALRVIFYEDPSLPLDPEDWPDSDD